MKLTRREFMRGSVLTALLAAVGIKPDPRRVLTTATGHEVWHHSGSVWHHSGSCHWARVSNFVRYTGDMIELPLTVPQGAQDGDLHHYCWYWDSMDEPTRLAIDGVWQEAKC